MALVLRATTMAAACVLMAVALSFVRHPYFNQVPFNAVVVLCVTAFWVARVPRDTRRGRLFDALLYAAVGQLAGAVAYVVTWAFFDVHGWQGLSQSFHAGAAMWLRRAVFDVPFFAFAPLQAVGAYALAVSARVSSESVKR